MRLSAIEIKKKEFQQKMRGADPEEVQSFLDQVSLEVETVNCEKKDLEDDLARANERLAHYVSLEQTIEKTLAASQQTAVKMEDQARHEADLILRDAALQRERMLADARLSLEKSERDLFRLRSEYDMTVARMRSMLSGFSSFLSSVEAERAPQPVPEPPTERGAAHPIELPASSIPASTMPATAAGGEMPAPSREPSAWAQ